MTRSNARTRLALGAVLVLAAAPGVTQVSRATVAVDGMSCPFCAYGVEKKLGQVPGVESVTVSMAEGSASLTAAQGASIEVSRIPEAVRQAGFTAGAIEVVAEGRVAGQADGGWRFDLGDSGRELLLVNLEGELAERVTALAGSATRVRVRGGLHLHSDAPPAVEPSAIEPIAVKEVQ